ncbi:nuclease-related domain-containing protein [Rheinheimera sp. NSM]|uniref:nuclease-related domain-containing protein n=1 Tax=Rheinheimera sp. NSM TaxID=3457884 RepID=UPI0040350FE1
MRWMRFTLPLLLFISPLAFGQKQYTEGACLLLQQQTERFFGQPNSRNYQDARRELNNHCQNPIPAPTHQLNLTNISAEPAATKPAAQNVARSKTVNASAVVLPAKQTVSTPQPLKPANVLQNLFAPVQAMFGGLLVYVMLFGSFIVLLSLLVRKYSAKLIGAVGEWTLHKVLVAKLPISYRHYRNLVLQTAQGDLTEVDHLIVSPYGIFVIEVKNYQGWIFGGEKQAEWTVQHFRRKHRFMNPLRQNYKHTEAVKYALGLDKTGADKVHSMVAFGPSAEFKTPLPVNVMHIAQVADYLQQFYQLCFSDEQLRQFSARLSIAAAEQKILRKQHLVQVQTGASK